MLGLTALLRDPAPKVLDMWVRIDLMHASRSTSRSTSLDAFSSPWGPAGEQSHIASTARSFNRND
jgi:hypothetical protein